LEISTDWYWFLVFSGGVLIITAIVLLIERKSKDDEILQLKPWVVIRNILGLQIVFYLLYLLTNFAINVASLEVFWAQQVFSFVDIAFYSKRGLLNGFSLILTFISMTVPLAAILPSYKNMADYCFTIFVIHFIVVSCVQGDFPISGAWWTAMVAGFLISWFASERLSYTLATMTYQSAMGTTHATKHQTNDREVDLSDLEMEEPTADPTHVEVKVDKGKDPSKKKKKKSKSPAEDDSSPKRKSKKSPKNVQSDHDVMTEVTKNAEKKEEEGVKGTEPNGTPDSQTKSPKKKKNKKKQGENTTTEVLYLVKDEASESTYTQEFPPPQQSAESVKEITESPLDESSKAELITQPKTEEKDTKNESPR